MPPVVLLVDDDDAIRNWIQRAISKAGVNASLQHCADGAQAIKYLSRQGEYQDEARFPFPSLVLLDLKMPEVDGFKVLEWKRQQPELGSLPVVVWSASDVAEDIGRAYSLGASSYVVKPMNGDDLIDVVKVLQDCWIGAEGL